MAQGKGTSVSRVLRELVAFHERELADVSMPVVTLFRLGHLLQRARRALGISPEPTHQRRRNALRGRGE